jgi:hypothetical protein
MRTRRTIGAARRRGRVARKRKSRSWRLFHAPHPPPAFAVRSTPACPAPCRRIHPHDRDVSNPAQNATTLSISRLPEFTCLCPLTGQPDFATLELEYVPDQRNLELKALKLYMWSFATRARSTRRDQPHARRRSCGPCAAFHAPDRALVRARRHLHHAWSPNTGASRGDRGMADAPLRSTSTPSIHRRRRCCRSTARAKRLFAFAQCVIDPGIRAAPGCCAPIPSIRSTRAGDPAGRRRAGLHQQHPGESLRLGFRVPCPPNRSGATSSSPSSARPAIRPDACFRSTNGRVCSRCPTVTASSSPPTSAIRRSTSTRRPPIGALQARSALGREGYRNLVVFSSLSKRSNVPGMRSGFVAGDAHPEGIPALPDLSWLRDEPGGPARLGGRLERRSARG